jgi:gamma-glutamylputrescine oxidase
MVLDLGHLGFGASGRNAGFLTTGSISHYLEMSKRLGADVAKKVWDFSEKNRELLIEHIIKGEEEALFYEQDGSVTVAQGEDAWKTLLIAASEMEKKGLNPECLEKKQISKCLQSNNFVGGVRFPRDASIHPQMLLQRLYKRVRDINPNFTLLENKPVYLLENKNSLNLVHTQKKVIKVPIVIFATNAYTPLLSSYFSDKIQPKRSQILSLEPCERILQGTYYVRPDKIYFRQIPTGELVIGGARHVDEEKELGYADEVTGKVQSALERFVNDHLPAFKGKKVSRRWSGVMGFTDSELPIIGQVPDTPSQYYALGFSGRGMGMAFHAAKHLVDFMDGKEKISSIFI